MIARAAEKTGCRSVAFTYNDPVIFLEYAIDVAEACRERGIKTVAVTAGYISEAPRVEFFRHMVARGLRTPTSVTSDGAPGLINAIKAMFGKALRIRCWFHRLSNIRAKLSEDRAPEVMAEVRAIRDAPTLDPARAQADRVINRYRREFPAVVACLEDDLEALLAAHRIPVRHRIKRADHQPGRT